MGMDVENKLAELLVQAEKDCGKMSAKFKACKGGKPEQKGKQPTEAEAKAKAKWEADLEKAYNAMVEGSLKVEVISVLNETELTLEEIQAAVVVVADKKGGK